MLCAALARTLIGETGCSADSSDAERAPLRVAAKQGQEIPPIVLLVVAHLDQADDAVEDVELFLPEHEVALLPGWAGKPDYSEASDEVAAERLSLCRRLSEAFRVGVRQKGDSPLFQQELKKGTVPLVIVAPAQALQQPVPKMTALSRATLAIRAGQEISPDAIAAWLTDHGFARVELVDVPGDFTVRGGIVDVFPAGDRPPVRIDFFGDQIESIRTFDVDTQRSRPDTIDELDLFGGLSQPPSPDGQTPGGPAPFDTCSFLDYLPDGAIVAFDEPTGIEELGRAYIDRTEDATGLYPIHTLLAPSDRLRQLFMAQFANTTETPLVPFG